MILASATFWGGISIFFKLLTRSGYSSMQSVMIRVVVAAIVFAAFLAFKDRQAFKIQLRDIPLFIGTGICSLLFFNFCYFNAIEKSTVAVAAVLLYTAPVFVMLMSAVFFRERITVKKVAALIVTFAGCTLVTGALGGGERITVPAFLFGIGSGFGYALYSILGKVALRKYSSETVTLYTFIFAAIGVLPFAGLDTFVKIPLTAEGVIGGIGMGTLCCTIPYIMYTKGLSLMEPGRAAIIATVEPVVAAVIGVAVFNEEVTLPKITGILLVVTAIVILNLRDKKSLQSHAI